MKIKPYIKKEEGIYSLIVNNKPFVALAGEVHNSSASNLKYMEEKVWPYVRDLNINTLLIPTYWECIEKDEGEFDFSIIKGIINQAREERKRLIVLWFGLWKNGMSTYVPEWVKLNEEYFRVESSSGTKLEIVSPLCNKAVRADKNAFNKLMEFIREYDQEEQTVIMVQVENEIGILGSDRDYSEYAEVKYKEIIPNVIAELYDVKGTWEEAFGEEAAEYFMEYYYANAIESISKEGKLAYDIPMFVNAWIEKYPWRPGTYPSGGPIARFKELWKCIAPSIFACTPDIYTSDFTGVCDEFYSDNNPLLIPEIRRDEFNVSNIFYAIGKYNALCYSPFGIEDFTTPPEQITGMCSPNLMKVLNIDSSAWDCKNTGVYLSNIYKILDNSMQIIVESRKNKKLYSFIRKNEYEKGDVIKLKEYDIKITYHNSGCKPKASGMIIEVSDNEFYIMGTSFDYTILTKKSERKNIGILNLEEGVFDNNKWISTRILNGDERYFTSFFENAGVNKIKLYKY